MKTRKTKTTESVRKLRASFADGPHMPWSVFIDEYMEETGTEFDEANERFELEMWRARLSGDEEQT
jgi:hypothetical protein